LPQTAWKRRFFETTRGRVIQLLRAGGRTVDELASMLGLSGTSVRAHLFQLESDGIVRHTPRRGTGKPTQVYSVAPEAEVFFHKAYAPLLAKLLQLLGEDLPPEELNRLMRKAGKGLAEGRAVPVGDVADRMRGAKTILTDLGGMAEVEQTDHKVTIRGLACPISAITAEHPEACVAVQSFLETLVGAPVTQCCNHTGSPKCCFEVAASSTPDGDQPAHTSTT
jgi:predicted ArsR family transcriptional regulator